MSFPFITKPVGAIITSCFMFPYVYFYNSNFGDTDHSLKLLVFFSFGVMLHFLQKIKAGTQKRLLFFEQPTYSDGKEGFWKNGYCLVPTILPFLHNFGIRIPWSLEEPDNGNEHRNENTFDVYHMRDQRLSNYTVTAQASLLGVNIDKAISNTITFMTGYEKGKPELLYQRVGFRIMLIAIAVGMLANLHHGLKQISFPSLPSIQSVGNEKVEILTLKSFLKGRPPTMPLEKNFAPVAGSTSHPYFYMENEADPRKYYLYKEPTFGEAYSEVRVTESLCAIIPAGRELVIRTAHPPLSYVNLRVDVTYAQKREYLNLFEKVFLSTKEAFLGGNRVISKKDSWDEVYDIWSSVDGLEHGIMVKALEKSELPAGSRPGGVVCF